MFSLCLTVFKDKELHELWRKWKKVNFVIFCRKKTITETKAKLDKYYGDSAPSILMVNKWFTEFPFGRASTIDAERSGRPVAIPETIEKIRNMVLADRRLKVREIIEAIGISQRAVVSILKDHLGMKKLSARWVPRLLTIDHKCNRVTTSIECLALFNRNKDEICNSGRNMDTPQHARDQTVGFAG